MDSIAPHNVLLRVLNSVAKEPEAPPPQEDESSEAAARAEMQYQQKPWTKPVEYLRYVTDDVAQQQRLLSFHKQGEQLVGDRSRDGVIPQTKDDEMVVVGLGDVWDDISGEVVSPKAEVKPVDLPFANSRKSGQQYWDDEKRKKRETQIF